MFRLLIPAIATSLALSNFVAAWSLTDTFQGSGFLNDFSFFTGTDPTSGRVVYVSKSTAQNKGLAYVQNGNFIARVDNTTTLSSSGAGRNSIRISSNKQWGQHVSIYNILHMPHGCATWPAVWERGDNWPAGGEIDIVEGVNNQASDSVTLHTSSGCSMPASRTMTGTHTGLVCDSSKTSNAGCGVTINDGSSYGTGFNNNGGGWYAVERSSTFIKVWFWARDSSSVPSEVRNGAGSINPGNWGVPDAYFPNTNCNIDSHFGPANIIINIDLCGSWAGSAYGSSGCPGSCDSYVNSNPAAFTSAYFSFAWVKVYQ
ncbi:2 beta-glucanase [Multifurca ochricompacta]|uniref:2 beta-glucanase n=1 Tax=Multifurca ochricompacta TaxID=376703 RepID=A0AAD4LY78_9AGAM|nr:2 beta-glucanase [Multifurca ochricompacta]KAI0292613.1 2 beta-glucanase [Multifurca ochricompacta]